MTKPHVVPVVLSKTNEVTITPPWFVDRSEYQPAQGTFQLLINGEEAFGAVHRAIESAKRSVCIICWAFQPSMHLVRDGKAPPIGKLLERKATEGVKIRTMCYAVHPFNVLGRVLGESNTPGRWQVRLGSRPPTSTDGQYEFDRAWFANYDDRQNFVARSGKRVGAWLGDEARKNLKFFSRGFSAADRAKIAMKSHEDNGLAAGTKAVLSATPSHPRKMVIVDYEDAERAVGFVMGHNMLDHYWDTSRHTANRYFRRYGAPDPRPNCGPSGAYPLHDFSCRVTGPVIGNLFFNFAQAWAKDTGEKLAPKPFEDYPLRKDDNNLFVMGQVLRTQPQYGVEDIKKCYLQAINNATRFVHIENQYFRWPPLAEKIKACAAGQLAAGRKPETHGPLYLFVITNSSDAGLGAGSINTYRMLDCLGRADAIPGVARLERLEAIPQERKTLASRLKQLEREKATLDQQSRLVGTPNGAVSRQRTEHYGALNREIDAIKARQRALDAEEARLRGQGRIAEQDAELAAAREETARLKAEKAVLDSTAGQVRGSGASADITARYARINARIAAAEAREKALEDARQEEVDKTVLPEERPGLKFHICTLVAPDTEPGEEWLEVYIHAKLMIIDDAFMTLGSTNINTRSMEVDSELNIAHHIERITTPARMRLWEMHTNGQGAQIAPMEAFETWGDIVKENKDRKSGKRAPFAPLAAFYRGSEERRNRD